ncbi:hypothetical protein [Nocardioides sp.]|uniref:hypothetical protein n=1 Tax=Nocardioides sp. TaxID=35761 RepID=UPI00271E87B6|nr:hypothetical protein [Nocardioides sp.]MDO9456567.1 hypothetical protein [Nocardioides sp.]
MARNTLSRSLHDVGLSAWFGGTLANAVSLNAAAGEAGRAGDSGAVANKGWDRWTPVNAAAIGAHLVGSVGQLSANKSRLGGQDGVATMALVKTGLTVAALGVTAYSRSLGKTVSAHGPVPVASGTQPSHETPDDVAAAQKKLAALQWVIPALTGVLVVVSSFAGEQQRPVDQLHGLTQRLLG